MMIGMNAGKDGLDEDTRRLLYAWLSFAVASLMFAGIFAFMIVTARTPFVHSLLPRPDYIRVALVGHVTLSFIIWFLAFEGLLWTLTSTILLNTIPFNRTLGWGGLLLSVAGALLVIIAAASGIGNPQFINYIPVLTHPLFYTGLLLLASGIILTLINTFLTIGRAWQEKSYEGRLPLLTFGMMISGAAGLSAIACFGLSYYSQIMAPSEKTPVNLEMLFWGGGHVLQFTNTITMVTVWLFLTNLVFKKFPMRDGYSKGLYLLYLTFILPAPFIYIFFDTSSTEYVRFFTGIMEYGLGPSTAIFSLAILAIIASKRFKDLPWNMPEFSSLVISMILFGLGGLISYKIYGYNTKIPSHYHGVIGGVTLAFMGLTNHLLFLLKRETYSRRLAAIQPYIYGTGQALFVLGLYWAGAHGVARKTFGAAQHLDNAAKMAGMILVGIGGGIAILGGILFIVNALASLLRNKRYSQT